MNFFELFDLPVAYHIDMSYLSQRYQDLQRLTHPDRFTAASVQDQTLALQKNAHINDAYSTLKDPLKRATHMLALKGMAIESEQHSVKDSAFLMQQLEWREHLEEIKDNEDALEALQSDITAQLTQKFNAFAQSYDASDAEYLADEVRRITFIYKFNQQIDAHLDKLDDF